MDYERIGARVRTETKDMLLELVKKKKKEVGKCNQSSFLAKLIHEEYNATFRRKRK